MPGMAVVLDGSFYRPARIETAPALTGVMEKAAGSVVVRSAGVVTLDDWTAATGSKTLVPRHVYYLASQPGKLVMDRPQDGPAIQVGISLSEIVLGVVLEHAVVEAARAVKLTALASWREAKEAAGFDTGLGFAIKIGDLDQQSLTAYKVLLDMAVEAGRRTTDSQVVLVDVGGQPYSIALAQFREVMLACGLACEALTRRYQIARAHLLRATTLEEIAAVTLPT